MPWSEGCPMEERAKFVLEALEGWTSMTELCARYGISRRVGYKWLHRYEEKGLAGLADRSRAPRRQAAATAPELVGEIVALRSKHPRGVRGSCGRGWTVRGRRGAGRRAAPSERF